MGNSRYEAVVAFLIQIDRDILFYILPIDDHTYNTPAYLLRIVDLNVECLTSKPPIN